MQFVRIGRNYYFSHLRRITILHRNNLNINLLNITTKRRINNNFNLPILKNRNLSNVGILFVSFSGLSLYYFLNYNNNNLNKKCDNNINNQFYYNKSLNNNNNNLKLSLNSLNSDNKIYWLYLYIRRFMFLLFNFSPLILLMPFAYFDILNIRKYWLSLLYPLFGNAGSTFIKLGQWISMRSDVFPIEICESLSNLRINAPCHSFSETCKTIENAFNKPIDEIFERFYIEPVASGSIAQIYKASIRKNGVKNMNDINNDIFEHDRNLEMNLTDGLFTKLKKLYLRRKLKKKYKNLYDDGEFIDCAVKVRHSKTLETMEIDINLLWKLTDIISCIPFLGGFKVPFFKRDLERYLESQIDLSHEANALKIFNDKFKNERDKVVFPKPIEPYISDDVFVETWEHGIPLSKLNKSKFTHEQLHKLGKNTYDIFMKMLLRDNFIHGDCHSGNILVCTPINDNINKINNDYPFGPIVFLDAGLTVGLNETGIDKLGKIMGHMANGNCKSAANIFGDFTLYNKLDTLQTNRNNIFKKELAKVIENSLIWRDPNRPHKGIPYIDIGNLLKNVLHITQQQKIVLDSHFSAVITSLGIVEGLIRSLDSNADFLSWGVPYLIKYRGINTLTQVAKETDQINKNKNRL